MKKWKKVVTAAAAVLAVVASTAVFAGCSGGAAAVTDVYSADPSSEGTAKYVTTPMQMIICNVEDITVYEDNTYSFSVATTIITGLTAISTGGNEEVINRGVTELVYYGTYTSAEDSGMTILTLAEPTRITVSNTNTLFTAGLPVGYMDTESWETSEELNTWWTAMGNTGDCTAEAFLDRMAFDETEVVVSATGTFSYVAYSLHNILLGM